MKELLKSLFSKYLTLWLIVAAASLAAFYLIGIGTGIWVASVGIVLVLGLKVIYPAVLSRMNKIKELWALFK